MSSWRSLGLILGLVVLAWPAAATTWYVHRTAGRIVWAGQYPQVGYADEALDDQVSLELQGFLHPGTSNNLPAHLALGVTTSSQAYGLAANWAYDAQTQQDLSGIAATMALLGTFPDGTTQQWPYPDIHGVPQFFPSINSFKSMYAGYAQVLQYLRAQGAIQALGGAPEWPSQTVTVP